MPVPVKVMPPGVEHNMLKLLCMYLLYERKEETELSQAYQALVAERHANFHVTASQREHSISASPWTECGNAACRQAMNILDRQRRPDIMMSELAAQLMATQYAVKLTPMPHEMRAMLEKRPDKSVPTFLAGERPNSQLVITDS